MKSNFNTLMLKKKFRASREFCPTKSRAPRAFPLRGFYFYFAISTYQLYF